MSKNCIVTINYNDYNLTQLFASNLAMYSCVDFVVIVDNNSTDNSILELRKIENDKIKLIDSSKNGGYSYGNNLGFKFLKEKFNLDFNIVFSNPDIEITESALLKLFNSVEENGIGIAGPTIIEGDTLNRGWKFPTVGNDILLNIPIVSKTVFKNILKYSDSKYQGDITQVDCVSGSIFAINAKVFDKVEMFDEGTFLYYEENIISKKLAKVNMKTVVLNNVEAIHHHSVSINKSFSSYSKLKVLKDSQIYYHSNYSTSKVGLGFLKLSVKMLLCVYGLRYGGEKNG